MRPLCSVYRLGLIAYEPAWRLQDRLAAEITAGERAPTLLLLEHPHTFTFGRRGKAENMLWDEAERARRGASVHWVDRGGDVTYHGPGQLVGYPLLPLSPVDLKAAGGDGKARLPQADYVGYVRRLEEALILALVRLGVEARQVEGLTGVWVDPGLHPRCTGCPPGLPPGPAKIAAIGVKVDVHGVSRHGFALNVNPDMSYWHGIIGCGLKDEHVTSLAEILDPLPTMEKVTDAVLVAFGEVFGMEMKEGFSDL